METSSSAETETAGRANHLVEELFDRLVAADASDELVDTGRSAVWRNGWRNVHGLGDPYVRVAVQLPGTKGVTEIERRLVASGAANEFPTADATVQRPGEKRTSFSSLGWENPLETMRPFLNHAQVESILEEKPTALQDRIGMAVGMEAMDATIRCFAEFRKPLESAAKDAKANTKALKAHLDASVDACVRQAATLLSKRTPAIEHIRALIDTAEPGEGTLALSAVAKMEPIDVGMAEAAIARFADAVRTLARLNTDEARRAHDLEDLLDAAIHMHTQHLTSAADQPCPVCDTDGAIDAGWLARATERVESLRAESATLMAARAEHAVAAAEMSALAHTSSLDPPDELVAGEAWRTSAVGWQAAVDALLGAAGGAQTAELDDLVAEAEGAVIALHGAQSDVRVEAVERVEASEAS